jgi:hypothetical protein
MPPDSGEPGPGGPGGPGGPPNDGPPPPPPHGPRGPGGPGGGRRKMPSGLSEEGKERAQYLRTVRPTCFVR